MLSRTCAIPPSISMGTPPSCGGTGSASLGCSSRSPVVSRELPPPGSWRPSRSTPGHAGWHSERGSPWDMFLTRPATTSSRPATSFGSTASLGGGARRSVHLASGSGTKRYGLNGARHAGRLARGPARHGGFPELRGMEGLGGRHPLLQGPQIVTSVTSRSRDHGQLGQQRAFVRSETHILFPGRA